MLHTLLIRLCAVLLCLAASSSVGGEEMSGDVFQRPIVRRNVDAQLLRLSPEVPARENGYELFAEIAAELEELDRYVDGERPAALNERRDLIHAFGMCDHVQPQRRKDLPDDFDDRVLKLGNYFRQSHRNLLRLATFQVIQFPANSTELSARSLHPLLDFLALESVRLCRAGRTREAFDLLRPVFVIMHRIESRDSAVNVIAANAELAFASGTLIRLSRNWTIQKSVLARAIDWLEECPPTIDAWRHAIAADFRMSLRTVAALPDFREWELVHAAYCARMVGEPGRLWSWIRNGRFAFNRIRASSLRHRDLQAILREHPSPFDLPETLRLASNLYLEQLASLELSWNHRRKNVEAKLQQEIGTISRQLRLDAMSTLELGFGGDYEPLDEYTTIRISKRLSSLRNPFGKMLLQSVVHGYRDTSTIAVHFVQTGTLVIHRTTLAVHLYQRRHGRLPERLDQLVSDGILKEVPADPFGDVLHYSAERAIVWSNGPDGIDHGGIDGRFHSDGLRMFQPFFDMIIPRDKRRPLPPPMPKPRVPGVDRVTYVMLPQLAGTQ